ncbi:MAG: MFS transporter, partial [Ktedonobacterales bacterium]
MPGHSTEDGIAGRRGLLLAAATISQFGGSVAQQGTVVLGVFFAAAYGLSLPQMGAVVSSLTVGLVISGLVVGTLVDRYGPRRVLFVGTLLLAATSATIGVIQPLAPTVIFLFLLGLALGVVPLAGTKAILMAWPLEHRGLPMGVRQMGVPLGAMVAALALPALASRFGLHPLYFGFAALIAAGGFIFCAVLPSSRPVARRARQETAPLRREAHSLIVPAFCGFLMVWGQYALATYTIPYLHGRDGISIAAAGVLLAVAQIGGAAARIFLGHISDRLNGRRDLVLLCSAIGGAVLACVLAVLPLHVPIVLLAPLWFALGMTMVGWNALMLTWSGERVSVRNAGAAIGMTTSAILLGAAISASGFGVIVQISGGYRVAWLS